MAPDRPRQMVDVMTDSLEFRILIQKNSDPFLKAWKVSQRSVGSSSDELQQLFSSLLTEPLILHFCSNVCRHASSLQVSEEIYVHPKLGARCILVMPPDGQGRPVLLSGLHPSARLSLD